MVRADTVAARAVTVRDAIAAAQNGSRNESGGSGFPHREAMRISGGLGLQKPASKNNSEASGAKGGNRYDKKNSDELRRAEWQDCIQREDLQRPAKPVKKEPEEPDIRTQVITIPEVLTIKELDREDEDSAFWNCEKAVPGRQVW